MSNISYCEIAVNHFTFDLDDADHVEQYRSRMLQERRVLIDIHRHLVQIGKF